MTINEAIENLRILRSSPLLYETVNHRDAVLLGIEALKCYGDLRRLGDPVNWKRLPTETI